MDAVAVSVAVAVVVVVVVRVLDVVVVVVIVVVVVVDVVVVVRSGRSGRCAHAMGGFMRSKATHRSHKHTFIAWHTTMMQEHYVAANFHCEYQITRDCRRNLVMYF